MNKTELENIIRKIVKEEVSIAVPKLIIELLQADKKNVVTESTQVARRPAPAARPAPAPQRPPVKKPVINTKNPLLNQILAETEPGFPQAEAGQGVDLGDLGVSFDGPMQMESAPVPSMLEEAAEPVINDYDQPSQGELPVPAGLFKRDFRSILKKADKIAKQNRPL
jgi:hypothetical protein